MILFYFYLVHNQGGLLTLSFLPLGDFDRTWRICLVGRRLVLTRVVCRSALAAAVGVLIIFTGRMVILVYEICFNLYLSYS